MIGIIGVLGITLVRPGEDNSQIIATLVGMLTPTAGVIIVLIHNGAAIKEVHYSLNSRLTEYLELAKAASLAQGKEQMRIELGAPLGLPPPEGTSTEAGTVVIPIPVPTPPLLLVPQKDEGEKDAEEPRSP
jgi:hypothetical protein